MKLKVLVVEDNRALNSNISLMLKKEGFSPSSAYDMDDAREKFHSVGPNVVLLDIMLPGGDGRDLAPEFRRNPEVIIIMLTALGDEESRDSAYLGGADDFVTKPFSLREIALKLRAIERRLLNASSIYRMGDLEFDLETGRIESGSGRAVLTRSQAGFLKALYIKHRKDGGCLKKAEILGSAVDESGRIHTMVNKLRGKLRQAGSEKVLIETVYGKGYRLDIVGCGGKSDE